MPVQASSPRGLDHLVIGVRDLDAASKPEWGYPYSFIGMRGPW